MRISRLFGKEMTDKRIKIQVWLVVGKENKESKGMTVYVSDEREFKRFLDKLTKWLKRMYGTPF